MSAARITVNADDMPSDTNLEGLIPESWVCVDCGVNTAPGLLNRAEMEKAIETAKAAGQWGGDKGIQQTMDTRAELYTVRENVWKAADMEPEGGCLCIGCLENRLGRALRPKDFLRGHPFNNPDMPASPRLRKRRKERS
jgi:hypothetical protein